MPIVISPRVRAKLEQKHCVSDDEIRQCFANLDGDFLRDPREQHDTDPPTHWFISETNRRRILKVVFVARRVEGADGAPDRTDVHIKTAYEPDGTEIALYQKLGSGCSD
jgi:hypothetical protein